MKGNVGKSADQITLWFSPNETETCSSQAASLYVLCQGVVLLLLLLSREGSLWPVRFFKIHCEVILLKRIGGDEDKGRKFMLSIFFFYSYHAYFRWLFKSWSKLWKNASVQCRFTWGFENIHSNPWTLRTDTKVWQKGVFLRVKLWFGSFFFFFKASC